MKYGKFCIFANTVTQNVRIVNPIFSSIDNENLLCDKLTVTGDDEYGCTGTYIISNEKASKSPDKPVYKLEGQDRYIYYNPGGDGWRIARKERLSGEKEGLHYYASKNFIPFLSKCAYMIDDILILFFLLRWS